MIYRTFVKSKLITNPIDFILVIKYYKSMTSRNRECVNNVLQKLSKRSPERFVLAHYNYFYGNYESSIELLKKNLDFYPSHVESFYLLNQCYKQINKYDLALSCLYNALQISQRKKTWLYLSQTISTISQFESFEKRFNKLKISNVNDLTLINYYSEAAQRVGLYQNAIDKWKYAISLVKKNNWQTRPKKAFFSSKLASKALLDFKEIFDRNEIEFFLVSGTLLGCVRDGKILPHDKDLDVGIWETAPLDLVKTIIRTSGCFEIMPKKTDDQIKIKHLNGSFIDIFVHYVEKNYTWHATSKIKWVNSIFSLKKHGFLKSSFLIPNNYEQYLIENYGNDWETPKKDFDSTFDTPNSLNLNLDELKVYLYRKVFEDKLQNNQENSSYLNILKNYSRNLDN